MPGPNLDPELIVQTVQTLRMRIAERFPAAGLVRVCDMLLEIAQQARRRSIDIGRPMLGLRILSALFVLITLTATGYTVQLLRIPNQPLPAAEFIQVVDAAFNALVLIGAALLFLVTLENRVKRSRALKAIHELRSLVHIIDMHQLTKDPEHILWDRSAYHTESSPKRTMTRYQLYRYLDYCSEMLALCGKVAALYVDNFSDSQAVSAVNDLENLTSGQGRKIWQKIMILHASPESPPVEHVEEKLVTAPQLSSSTSPADLS